MANSAVMQDIKGILNSSSIALEIYPGVKPNPTLLQVSAGVEKFVGGSPNDCAIRNGILIYY